MQLPARAAIAMFAKTDPGGPRRFDEQPQRARNLAFEVMVSLQALIDHRAFERVVVDRDNRARRRLSARRIPRRLAADEQHEIGIAEERADRRAEVQRMVLWEAPEGRTPAAADRNAEKSGEFRQGVERGRIASRGIGEDDRVARSDQQLGDLLDIVIPGSGPRRRRDLSRFFGRRPWLKHYFHWS